MPTQYATRHAQHSTPSGKAGFTLLEVIIALAILGIGFALAMELLATGVRSAKASEEYTQAVLLAQHKMAEVSVARDLTRAADGGNWAADSVGHRRSGRSNRRKSFPVDSIV
ncbi:MAG: type II secretion system GspH family protein [Candidatus Methylomirabilis sp.]|nr:type II secretion system GspH family protein [Candidatus Methylomirabilis sp.]